MPWAAEHRVEGGERERDGVLNDSVAVAEAIAIMVVPKPVVQRRARNRERESEWAWESRVMEVWVCGYGDRSLECEDMMMRTCHVGAHVIRASPRMTAKNYCNN